MEFSPDPRPVPRNKAMSKGLLLAWIALGTMGGFFVSGVHGQSVDPNGDYQAELPRIPPVEPSDALSTFQVIPGFHLELVAHEPQVCSPVAITWDEQGTMFVVEMRGYSEQRNEGMGRIRRLVDEDGDGFYERADIYAERLMWPTALACWRGGLLVADAPDMLYFEDTDRDGRADARRVVFTGFGTGNVQGLLNTLEWHFDHRIHGATSSNQGLVTAMEHPKAPPIDLRGRDFSIDPRTMTLRAECGGGQHGATFDAWGNRFVCANSDHLQFVPFEQRYLERDPRLVVPTTRYSIAADGPQATVYRASPIEPWRIVRTRLRVAGAVPGPIEGGGQPAGYFTGATGLTAVRGSAFQGHWKDVVVVGDAGGNLAHRKQLQRDGAGFRGERMDSESELVASRDIWFRPVQFANGPDGGFYIIDMYREVIEHPDSLPPAIKRHLDLTSGRERGRIYRLVPDGYQRPLVPDFSAFSTHELVASLDHPNLWHRATASRLLCERQDPKQVPELLALVADPGTGDLGKLWALSALEDCGALTRAALLPALHSPNPELRRRAVEFSESLLSTDSEVATEILRKVGDPSPEVRMQVAFAVGERPALDRIALLTTLLTHDSEDRLIRAACRASMDGIEMELLKRLLEDAQWRRTPAAVTCLREIIQQLEGAAIPDWSRLLGQLVALPAADNVLLAELAGSLPRGGVSKANGETAVSSTPQLLDDLRRRIEAWAIAVSDDASQDVSTRVSAIRALEIASFAEIRELTPTLLSPAQPAEIQRALVGMLARRDEPEIAGLLLGQVASATPSTRRACLEMLTSRVPWVDALLTALEQGELSSNQVDALILRTLGEHPDAHFAERARAIQDRGQPRDVRELLATYRSALSAVGDVTVGAEVFQKNCASCHQIGKVGAPLGPSLPAMVSRGREAILLAMLDPNREVNPQFENFIVTTRDGRVVAGMIESETDQGIQLRRSEGAAEWIARADIEEFQGTGRSFMPEGLERQVDPEAMASLFTFMESLTRTTEP